MSDKAPWDDAMSDGCSVPAFVLRLDPELKNVCESCRDLCVAHDHAYYDGGSTFDKLVADAELARGIYNRTQDSRLARLFFDAVQTFGESHWGQQVGGIHHALALQYGLAAPQAP